MCDLISSSMTDYMPLKPFWATIAAQMRSASCSAVCSFVMSSAVRGCRCRDDCCVGLAARSDPRFPVVTGARLARLAFLRSLRGARLRTNATIFFGSSLLIVGLGAPAARPRPAGGGPSPRRCGIQRLRPCRPWKDYQSLFGCASDARSNEEPGYADDTATGLAR